MKSQDIVLLLKLASLRHREKSVVTGQPVPAPIFDWQGWDGEEELEYDPDIPNKAFSDFYTVRALSASLGISKSEISASLKRSFETGIAVRDRKSGNPKVNARVLLDFIVHGLKYVFPPKVGRIERGIPTAAAAPILQGKLMAAGQYIYVWPDAHGKDMGQSIEPLYKSVPFAVKKDAELYAYLALVDAVRLGTPREMSVAVKMLETKLIGP